MDRPWPGYAGMVAIWRNRDCGAFSHAHSFLRREKLCHRHYGMAILGAFTHPLLAHASTPN